MERKCLYCKEEFQGRVDKKFCTSYCKSGYHYQYNQNKEESLYKKIDIQLKKNRQLLKQYNKAGLAKVDKEKLVREGFNPHYFTHYWKNKKQQVYLFCYEYGFLKLKDQYKEDKYLLIKWQDYMDHK